MEVFGGSAFYGDDERERVAMCMEDCTGGEFEFEKIGTTYD